MLKHDKDFILKFFLTFVLFFFVLTYAVVNKSTIDKQIEIITEGSMVFAKATTYEIFQINKTKPNFDTDTYNIEMLIFNQINEVRAEKDLMPLKWDPLLAELARTHSLDMVNYNYFNHTDLAGIGPTDRAKRLGIKTRIETKDKIYIGIGENIGLMPRGIVQDVGVLITDEDLAWGMIYRWMVSPPHRDNILNDEYFFTGIGVAYDGVGSYYITQNFQ